ncbi:hypothetical protein QAD02_021132 [Eretmocerus hayati]|uniref:Uncharacterized protein n=1 Tax=Eretmocerus hayati TaxID=131215 RepID=A0ACC2PRW9_9HYME|nr:hypothetical protein QAD02_021132 [Eretmocerus hayati]
MQIRGVFTMLIYNALNHSNSQKCIVCNATIGQFNDIDFILRKTKNEGNIRCGFTILHARIRFMELALNIAERLVLPKPTWRVPQALKYITKGQAKEIQKDLKSSLRITVNKPKQGFENTNSGNTARIFFDHVDVVAELTGVNENFLRGLRITLGVINCGLDVNVDAFRSCNLETAREYVRLYPFYKMPSTMHLILMHGHDLVKRMHPAVGLCSEEPIESSHKVLKSLREHRARKCTDCECG